MHMWYINSTLIFWADLDIYPLILKIQDRNNTRFRNVLSSVTTDPSNIFLPGAVLQIILKNTEYLQWTTLSHRITCQKGCLKSIYILDPSEIEDNVPPNAYSPLSLGLRWPRYQPLPLPPSRCLSITTWLSNIWLRHSALELPGTRKETKVG